MEVIPNSHTVPKVCKGKEIRECDKEGIWLHPVYKNYGIDSEYNLYRIHKTTGEAVKKVWKFRKIDGRYSIFFTNICGRYFSKAKFIYECIWNKVVKAGYCVDHENNVSTDDYIENLQVLTSTANNRKCVFKTQRTSEKHIFKDKGSGKKFVKMKFFIKEIDNIEDGKKIRDEIMEILKKYDNIEIY